MECLCARCTLSGRFSHFLLKDRTLLTAASSHLAKLELTLDIVPFAPKRAIKLMHLLLHTLLFKKSFLFWQLYYHRTQQYFSCTEPVFHILEARWAIGNWCRLPGDWVKMTKKGSGKRALRPSEYATFCSEGVCWQWIKLSLPNDCCSCQ